MNRDYIKNLPDVYNKNLSSNNEKILEIEKAIVDSAIEDLEDVETTLDLNSATGKTLDYYGEIYDQPRGSFTDDQYRYMIRGKIAQIQSSGSINDVLKSLVYTFNCEFEEVGVENDTIPAQIKVIKVPYENLNQSGIDTEQAIELIYSMLPVGVSVNSVDIVYDSSLRFTFGTAEDEYDENQGFGNEEQTIGGVLGTLGSY